MLTLLSRSLCKVRHPVIPTAAGKTPHRCGAGDLYLATILGDSRDAWPVRIGRIPSDGMLEDPKGLGSRKVPTPNVAYLLGRAYLAPAGAHLIVESRTVNCVG